MRGDHPDGHRRGVLGTALDKLTTATATTRAATASSKASTVLWNVIDTPVRAYITTHSTGLAISASTAYALWQLAGLAGFIGGFLRSTAARLAWITWGVGDHRRRRVVRDPRHRQAHRRRHHGHRMGTHLDARTARPEPAPRDLQRPAGIPAERRDPA
ncbi:hypothetical protein ACFVVP_39255 [Streptomyces sp. NPDC058128]|uniref:hypothetical protein n=1 Tax=Streptomyces sp. NPDC058128 TaxID=3346352 RepID=UPI0036EF184F